MNIWKELVKVGSAVEDILPSFPLNYETARSRLDKWTLFIHSREMEELIQKVWGEEVGKSENLVCLQLLYSGVINMFKDLTSGWYKDLKCVHSVYIDSNENVYCSNCRSPIVCIEMD